MKIHIVQQGDTLWKLAKSYDVDFEQLKAVNNHLSNPDLIMPGMKIKIPTSGVPVKKQVVKKEEAIIAPASKEAIKAKEVPLPKKEEVIVKKEEIKIQPPPPAPVQQPVQVQPLTQQQYLQHMNMNFNVYKPMPAPPAPIAAPAPVPVAPPAPPKLPEVKEMPKPVAPPAPIQEIQKPVTQPVAPPPPPPMQMPVAQQGCYPITGIMPGCSYPPMYPQYPSYGPGIPYGYQMPMAPQMAPYQAPVMPGYPTQFPSYPGSSFGMAPGCSETGDVGVPVVPSGTMQAPPMQVPQPMQWNTQGMFGDLTLQQQQPIPQSPPWGYQPQPMFPPQQWQTPPQQWQTPPQQWSQQAQQMRNEELDNDKEE